MTTPAPSPSSQQGGTVDTGATLPVGNYLSTGATDPQQSGEAATPHSESGEAAVAEADAPAPLEWSAITLPEGLSVPEETQTEFLGIMNNAELAPAERAQALIDLQTKFAETTLAETRTAMQDFWNQTQTEWRTALTAHPDFAGDKLNPALDQIRTGLRAAGADDAVFEAFTVTGAGNHPAILPVLLRLVQPHLEGGAVHGGNPGRPLSNEEKAMSLYPSMKPKG